MVAIRPEGETFVAYGSRMAAIRPEGETFVTACKRTQ